MHNFLIIILKKQIIKMKRNLHLGDFITLTCQICTKATGPYINIKRLIIINSKY